MNIEKISSFWPGWQIGELIGQGSYGKVYKAFKQEHSLLSVAAIKVISIPQSNAEIEALRMEGLDASSSKTYFSGIVDDFINEIKLMDSMKGASNIVSVEDFKVVEHDDSIGWDIFIRMELLTPFPRYTDGRILSEDEVIKVACDVCTALEFCSKQNIIHRDIKPDNIFVSKFGDFKVGDFGIAKQLDKTAYALSAKGTQSYIAPEILHGQSYDQSVDIYSLGIVLYKLLNGNRHPFISPDSPQTSYKERENAIARRLAGEPLPPPCNASPELASIILTACSYDPKKRFKNPTALKKALLNYKSTKAASKQAPIPPNIQTSIGASPCAEQDLNKTVAIRRPSAAQNIPNNSYTSQTHSSNEQSAAVGYDKTVAIGDNEPIYTPPSPPPNPPYNSVSKPPQKKNKAWLIIIIILLIIALAVAGVILWKSDVFNFSSPSSQTEEKTDTEKTTSEAEDSEPETEAAESDTEDTQAPDTTYYNDPEPEIIVEDMLFVSEVEGGVFFSSDSFTAEVKKIKFDDNADDFNIYFRFKNNTSETLNVLIEYVAINTVVSYNPALYKIEAGETVDDYIYIYEDYCAALGINSITDLSSFVLYYDILDSDFNETLVSESCEFITANYEENINININGDYFIEENDIKALVYAFTSNYDTDLTIAVKSIGNNYRIHIDEFYINGIEFKFDDDEGYDIFAEDGYLMMDNIYLDDDDLATIGLTPEEVETVQFSGTVYNNDTNRRAYDFESKVFEARENLPD